CVLYDQKDMLRSGWGDVVEKRPDVAARLAAGRFDLDHVGPEIGEQFAAELALFIGEFQDPQACQRARQNLGIAHLSIASMYGKRGPSVGQNVPSAKPVRSSSRLYPSKPSTISRVC